MANPDVARLESLAREGRAQIPRMLTHAGSGHPGGLGGAVAELVGEARLTPLKRVGVASFGESGDAKGLYAKHGLDAAGIARAARALLKR